MQLTPKFSHKKLAQEKLFWGITSEKIGTIHNTTFPSQNINIEHNSSKCHEKMIF